jgi:hypothetical protein
MWNCDVTLSFQHGKHVFRDIALVVVSTFSNKLLSVLDHSVQVRNTCLFLGVVSRWLGLNNFFLVEETHPCIGYNLAFSPHNVSD